MPSFEVRWTDEAEIDLENILAYYFDEAGERVAKAIHDLLKMLSWHRMKIIIRREF